MVPDMLRSALLLIVLGAALGATILGYKALVRWEERASDPRGEGAVSGSVERRLHLTLDTRWDTDKRRRFECREVK